MEVTFIEYKRGVKDKKYLTDNTKAPPLFIYISKIINLKTINNFIYKIPGLAVKLRQKTYKSLRNIWQAIKTIARFI